MSSYSGVLKIVRFNWPWYAAAAAATLTTLVCLFLTVLPRIAIAAVVGALVIANLWVLMSLAVSHYVYDRSAVARGAWLGNIDPTKVRRAMILHAGQDEAAPTVERVMPSIKFDVFDFYNEERNGTSSLRRARALNPHRDLAIRPDEIPADDSAFDLVLAVFAAHEIRDESQRTAFFREVHRVLAPTGHVIVVEHLRDFWNLVAYGPGAFHFLSERTWLHSFVAAHLDVHRDVRCTRFVRVFELEKRG